MGADCHARSRVVVVSALYVTRFRSDTRDMRMPGRSRLTVLILSPALGAMCMLTASAAPVANPAAVRAGSETVPVAHRGDAADDPAIWVDPNRPAQSLVIGNDKLGALEVYGLDGSRRQRITSTKHWGNVDVRQSVTIRGQTTDVVAAINGGLRVFTVNPATHMLESITDGTGTLNVGTGGGLCLYSPASGGVYVFVVNRAGRVRQYQLNDPDSDGLIQVSLRREFNVGSEAEGCLADDQTGRLYVSEEDVALWRYGAEPSDGSTRTAVDDIGANGHLVSDIEGIALVEKGTGGHLIVSAQSVANGKNSYFAVYDRNSNAYEGAFRIVDGPDADGCQRTDGVAAYSGGLGPMYPDGLFVCQDNGNTAPGVGYQDFKLTSLAPVLAAL